LFKSKKRLASAWAKGLMFGKAVGARDERDRITGILIGLLHLDCNCFECDAYLTAIRLIKGDKND